MPILYVLLLFLFLPSYIQQNILYVDPLSINQPSYFPTIYDANIKIGSSTGEIIVINSVKNTLLDKKIEILNKVDLMVTDEIKINIDFLKGGQVCVKENAVLSVNYFRFAFNEVEYEFDSAFDVAKNGQIIFNVFFVLVYVHLQQNKINKPIEK